MKKSFKTSLFISFLMLALIVLIVSGGFLISAVEKKIEYDYEKESIQRLENTEITLNEFLNNVEGTINLISDDENIISSVKETDSWLVKKAYNRLYALTEGVREHAAFHLYDGEGHVVLSTSTLDTSDDQSVYWGIFKEAYTHPEKIIIRNAGYEVRRKDSVICLAKAIVLNDECVGFILSDISEAHLLSVLDEVPSNGSEILILDEFLDEVYSTCDKDIFSEDDFTYYSREMENYDFTLVTGKRGVFSESLKNTMLYVIVAMAFVSLLLSFIIARIFSNRLMEPLNEMTCAMEKIREGDLSVQMNSMRSDEFGQLSRDFDDMTNALRVYVELREKQQQELSESSIAMMQAQLNPHFLYNTLDTIKWIGKANHIPELAIMSSSLAKILRASISSDTFVTLDSEIKLIDNYIQIQEIRFPGEFSYDAEVPMELEDVVVPKLILQPIVENAIVHGLKDREDGYIFLNVYEQNSHLMIDIEDNGRGMDEEMLESLNARDAEKLKGHIGFYNVATIIKLHYGLNYGVYAQNLEEGGVRVTIELPIKRGEEDVKSTGN